MCFIVATHGVTHTYILCVVGLSGMYIVSHTQNIYTISRMYMHISCSKNEKRREGRQGGGRGGRAHRSGGYYIAFW